MTTYDAIIVGARCAGSVAAGSLARAGWKVLLVDKATFPSDTMSTHIIFPNTIARFESLGIWERLVDRHELSAFYQRWRVLGYELAGPFTPIDGHDKATCIRRISLDNVLVNWAVDAGVETRFGMKVVSLLGKGEDGDPVRGVVLEGGEEVRAPWIIGADGRASTVAGLLGLEKKKPLSGEQAYLFAYWRGLPPSDIGTIDVDDSKHGLMWNPCEDGTHIVSFAAPPEVTSGSKTDRERAYAHGIRHFPDTLKDSDFDKAERISDLVVVPETLMRGFYRKADGPGWALIGDAGHFKHPGTAQGISDAVEHAMYVGEALAGADPELEGFHEWRKERSIEHYEWSFIYGSWPVPEMASPYMRGLSSDPVATQDWLDVLTRRNRPSTVNTSERLGRWFSAPVQSG